MLRVRWLAVAGAMAVIAGGLGVITAAPQAATPTSTPIAVIHVSGAFHATYTITPTTPQGCDAGWKTASNQVQLWVRRHKHLWPELSVTKFHPRASTHKINLKTSPSLAVEFDTEGSGNWVAGHFFLYQIPHAANYGSGTATTNPSMTTGTLNAELVWSRLGPKVGPIHVTAHWNCPPSDG